LSGLAIGSRAADQAATDSNEKLRVGVFDSRALVVAYLRTPEFNQHIKQLMEERNKAKAAGDQEKVKRLEAEGKAEQELRHLQGFGGTPVNDILRHIKDKLPEIAKEAHVDLMVSKWDVAYQAPGARVVDITELMVKPFNPDARVKRIIEDLRKQPLVPIEELKKMRATE
jgi:hypothetical protein